MRTRIAVMLFGLLLVIPGSGWAQTQGIIRFYPPVVYPWMTCTSAACTSTVPVIVPNGTAANNGLQFAQGAGYGLHASAGFVQVSFNGTDVLTLNNVLMSGVADTSVIGSSATPYAGIIVNRYMQGSKSKTLVDNTATAFVRLTVSDDDYEGCGFVWTAYAEDAGTDARQTRTGRTHAAILNNSGTEACAFSTGDEAVLVTAGTFTCSFDCNSAAADTVDLRATCNTSLDADAETLTFEYRLDCPSTITTVTPQ